MKKYFYSNGKEKHGPLGLDELKQKDISEETLIWFEGLDDWTPAGELDEIKPVLELQPPPIFTRTSQRLRESGEPDEGAVEVSDMKSEQSRPTKKAMFSNPFSFEGRIRRMEFGISWILFTVGLQIIGLIQINETGGYVIYYLLLIPILWFSLAQGAKRCHDIGTSGWWQFIPLYFFWLLFQKGHPGVNEYGPNPKV